MIIPALVLSLRHTRAGIQRLLGWNTVEIFHLMAVIFVHECLWLTGHIYVTLIETILFAFKRVLLQHLLAGADGTVLTNKTIGTFLCILLTRVMFPQKQLYGHKFHCYQ